MKIEYVCYLFTTIAVSNLITVSAITKTREADVLNLNGIQDGVGVTERGVTERGLTREKNGAGKGKDPTVTETQENRSFFKPEADRRGSFYPSGPPLGPGSSFGPGSGSNFGPGHGSNFGPGLGSNFGPGHGSNFGPGSGSNFGPSSGSSFGHGPNYHSSGNGFSYGAPSGPSSDYPPPYAGSYPSRPVSPPSSPPSEHSGYGAGLGGGFPLAPSGGGHGQGHNHAMALKGLLLPLAGVALLGAAAVLAKSNPVLLQLGVVSGKRRRRDVGGDIREEYPENPFVRPEK